MKTHIQSDFFQKLNDVESGTSGSRSASTSHGGSGGRGRRKLKRPIQVRRPLHVVFKSSKARGQLGFRTSKNYAFVEATLKYQARRHFIDLMSYVIRGNHLHLKAKCRRRVDLQNFLRRGGSVIAQKITGARPGRPFGRFWDDLVFSRILTSRFEELTLGRYFEANRVEALYGYEAREDFLLRTRRSRRKGRRLSQFAFV